MKIIQVIGDSSISGGPRHVLLLAKELARRGHQQIVICPPGYLANQLEKAGIQTVKIRMRGPFDRQADHQIRAVLLKEKPDILHCHGVRGGWLGRLAARKIPHLPVVYTEHLWTKEYHLSNPLWEQFQIRGLQFLDRYTQKTIAVSKAVRAGLIHRKITRPEKIVVIPNFLPPEVFQLKRYQKPRSVGIMIGSVGSLNPQKNYQTLIRAAEVIHRNHQVIHSPVKFQIVGEGKLQKKLQNLIARAKLEKVFFLRGRVEDVYETMRHFTIYVQPSISESFGLAVAEAMALQLPVVASEISAFKELVKPNQTGLLVPPKDYRGLAKALQKLIQNPGLCQRLGQNASREVKKRYTIERVVPKIIKVYQEAIEEKRQSFSHT